MGGRYYYDLILQKRQQRLREVPLLALGHTVIAIREIGTLYSRPPSTEIPQALVQAAGRD